MGTRSTGPLRAAERPKARSGGATDAAEGATTRMRRTTRTGRTTRNWRTTGTGATTRAGTVMKIRNGRPFMYTRITLGLTHMRPSGLLYALCHGRTRTAAALQVSRSPNRVGGDAVRSIGERGAGMADMRPFTQDHCALSLGVPGELFVARPYDGGDVSESTRLPPTTACGQEAKLLSLLHTCRTTGYQAQTWSQKWVQGDLP